MSDGGKSHSEKYGIKFYIKTDEELEAEFETNKKNNKTLPVQYRLPESMIEYAEKLIVENNLSIKFIQKEKIPDDLKTERLKYLQKHQELLLEWFENLKKESNN
jgi:hypothetical protein